MKRTLLSLLLLHGSGLAVHVEPFLPITSVAQDLKQGWQDSRFQVHVPYATQVTVTLTGADWTPGAVGDNRYSKQDVQTRFDLTGEGVQQSSVYGTGPKRTQTVFQGVLKPGTYQLATHSAGRGTNAYQVQVAGAGVEVQAEHLALTVQGKGWVKALQVKEKKNLSLFLSDTEGEGELEVRFWPDGQARPRMHRLKDGLPLVLNQESGVLEVRQPKGAKQRANTFQVNAFVGGKAEAFTFTGPPQQVVVEAMALVGGQLTPGAGLLQVESRQVQLGPGEVYVMMPGSEVQVLPVPGGTPVSETLQGADGQLWAVYQPKINRQVNINGCHNGTEVVQVLVESLYPAALPLQVLLDLSEDLTTLDANEVNLNFQGHFQHQVRVKGGAGGKVTVGINGQSTVHDLPPCKEAPPKKPLG